MPARVLIVDDSAVIRGLMTRALTADADINVAGSAANGEMAISLAKSLLPDIIILDIEMPIMDGITALPQILKVSPQSKIIMASTLTQRNASISMEALQLGATDYLAKPSAKIGNEVDIFYRELISKIKALSGLPTTPRPVATTAEVKPATISVAGPAVAPVTPAPASSVVLNPMGTRALAIASSTGGPQALLTVFEHIKGKLGGIPIYITQHMPATFTTILAEHITKIGGRTCSEVKGGEHPIPGQAYLAPGDYHMVMEKINGQVTININQDAPENFCRPAADPMLRSLAAIYGPNLAVVVLTGMGQDGMEGSKEVIRQGGSVVAQDEKSCVVYGMPKAVVDAKLCKAVLPLSELGSFLIQQIDGRR